MNIPDDMFDWVEIRHLEYLTHERNVLAMVLRLWAYVYRRRTDNLVMTEERLASICGWQDEPARWRELLIETDLIESAPFPDGNNQWIVKVFGLYEANKRDIASRRNGKKGGRPRKAKKQSAGSSDPDPSFSDSPNSPNNVGKSPTLISNDLPKPTSHLGYGWVSSEKSDLISNDLPKPTSHLGFQAKEEREKQKDKEERKVSPTPPLKKEETEREKEKEEIPSPYPPTPPLIAGGIPQGDGVSIDFLISQICEIFQTNAGLLSYEARRSITAFAPHVCVSDVKKLRALFSPPRRHDEPNDLLRFRPHSANRLAMALSENLDVARQYWIQTPEGQRERTAEIRRKNEPDGFRQWMAGEYPEDARSIDTLSEMNYSRFRTEYQTIKRQQAR